MTRARIAAALFVVLASLPVSAQFREVAHDIEKTSGMSRVHVPGFWFARMVTRIADPEGVHDIRLAIFDSSSVRGTFDADAIMRAKLGPEWQAIVRFADHRSGEQGFIYAKPAGPREISMMMFVVDDEESVLTELRIDADQLAKFVEESSDGDARVE